MFSGEGKNPGPLLVLQPGHQTPAVAIPTELLQVATCTGTYGANLRPKNAFFVKTG